MTPEQETVDEQSLFDGAVSNEPEVPAVESTVDEPAEPSQPRDPAGRFAAKQDEEPLVADPAARPQVDDNAPQVPSWRVREINEEKRVLAAELETLRAEKARWATQQQQPRAAAPAPEQPVVEAPDPLLDPKGYAKHIRDEIRNEMIAERREASLQNAATKYKEEFGEAYQAAQQKMSPALRAMMHESRDPGETLIKWHREEKAKAEVGDDLAAYKKRLRDEALKDPEFRKAAMEAWRNEQPAPSNGRPKIDLPTSINGLSRANALLKPDENPSDQQLFEAIAG